MDIRTRGVALDAALKSLFRGLQRRAVPDRIRSVVEQLDEAPPAEQSAEPQGQLKRKR